MIVDKTHKVIYLHNPKCGGTFLRSSYIEKYGRTDATNWWGGYTYEFGTDLGHIIYEDLPRFIPDFGEYRLLVMVRNPYNRFFSGINETKHHYNHLCRFRMVHFFSYFIHYIYYLTLRCGRLSRLEKVYEIIREIFSFVFLYKLRKMLFLSTSDFCEKLCASGKNEQDRFLRNKRIPWLNPQSDFMGGKVEVLRYESVSDWEILLNAFDLSEYSDRLKIAKDYDIPESVCEMIRRLYPEDSLLFDLYKNIANDNENNSCN